MNKTANNDNGVGNKTNEFLVGNSYCYLLLLLLLKGVIVFEVV